jgi:LacI family transcriptional regulator
MSERALTIKEMALKAKVSVATISRVMNPETRGMVAPSTIKRIDALIEKHGYTTNLAAKHLRQSTTKTIGIVFPYVPGIFYSEYYTRILAGATEYILETDYRFKMLLLKEGKNWDGYNFRTAEAVDGLIMVHWFKIFSNMEALKKISVPVVMINDYDPQVKAHFVYADQFQGGQLAAEHLFTNGHRRTAIFTGPAWSKDSYLRAEGYKTYFEQKGIVFNANQMLDGKYIEKIAYARVEELLKKNPGITAIFCCNDQMAYGVLRRFKELGIRCPEDISIVGFDDEDKSAYIQPALTTIHVDAAILAKEAVKMLLHQIKDSKNSNHVTLSTPVLLVQRETVKSI